MTTTAWDCCFAYGYNEKSELTNAVAAVDSDYRYLYDFDDIGNRISSLGLGTNRTYTANNLNQYTSISNYALSASPREEFVPQFDDDGNQTLIKTATGIWQVTYNGENRPVLWENVSTNSPTPNSPTSSLISMSFDRMGRRVTKNNQRFVYDGYLCIGKIEDSTSIHYSLSPIHCFVWDPTEPIATRPLAWLVLRSLGEGGYYTHDGNKNVSEVFASEGAISAHYEYAPFGALAAQRGTSSTSNPWRFSSEYAEDDTATVYYNYRHYETTNGRWTSRDPEEENLSNMLYSLVHYYEKRLYGIRNGRPPFKLVQKNEMDHVNDARDFTFEQQKDKDFKWYHIELNLFLVRYGDEESCKKGNLINITPLVDESVLNSQKASYVRWDASGKHTWHGN